jgi:hypothetical protein
MDREGCMWCMSEFRPRDTRDEELIGRCAMARLEDRAYGASAFEPSQRILDGASGQPGVTLKGFQAGVGIAFEVGVVGDPVEHERFIACEFVLGLDIRNDVKYPTC